MAQRRSDWPSISDAELAVLKELWTSGPRTVRAVCESLEAAGHGWAYTTVQTMLHRLEDKGYVAVDRDRTAHLFAARVSRDALLGRRLKELAEQLCDGAATPLLLSLVERRRFTRDEIARFRRLLDEAEQKTRKRKGGGL